MSSHPGRLGTPWLLDGILDSRSQLPIRIHSTVTAGYSDIIFALFDLLGLQFAPRHAGLPTPACGSPNPLTTAQSAGCKHRVEPDLISGQWMSCCASRDRLPKAP